MSTVSGVSRVLDTFELRRLTVASVASVAFPGGMGEWEMAEHKWEMSVNQRYFWENTADFQH